jgi:hypothetical protein
MVRCPARDDRDSALLLDRLLSGIDVEYWFFTSRSSLGYGSCSEPFHGGLRLRTSDIWSAV